VYCPGCGTGQSAEHRFCVACGERLPVDLVRPSGPKVSRWFLSIPVAPDDPPSAALRVSRYLEDVEITTSDGSVRVPSHHVRFSIWINDRAVAAISIPDDEADRLADFLGAWIPEEGEPARDRPVTQ
jgi:hypothetical protein